MQLARCPKALSHLDPYRHCRNRTIRPAGTKLICVCSGQMGAHVLRRASRLARDPDWVRNAALTLCTLAVHLHLGVLIQRARGLLDRFTEIFGLIHKLDISV
jgi:hypothetical protein